MIAYIGTRLARGLLTLFGVLTVAFLALRLNGSPAVAMIPQGSPQAIADLNTALGFDGSLLSQYARYLGNAAQGDFGTSFAQEGVPTVQLVLDRMPATLELAATALVLGMLAGFGLAFLIQLTDGRRLRTAMIWLGVARQATPTFLFGVLLVLVFSVKLGWLPSIGRGGVQNLVLPALALGTFEVTLYMRLLDASLTEQLQRDYVRTAHAKGQRRSVILLRHMLPNALLPTLTVAGLNFGAMLGGVVVVEAVFNWPGVGQLLVNSVNARDYPVVQTTLLVVAAIFVLVNLAVDLLYAVLDPRVRLR
ncbi:MAG TPA: ABC transporter permease [Mycobacteriales bacterium]|nr:ABC transporter permease [Mycobacteriales bacterium]